MAYHWFHKKFFYASAIPLSDLFWQSSSRKEELGILVVEWKWLFFFCKFRFKTHCDNQKSNAHLKITKKNRRGGAVLCLFGPSYIALHQNLRHPSTMVRTNEIRRSPLKNTESTFFGTLCRVISKCFICFVEYLQYQNMAPAIWSNRK